MRLRQLNQYLSERRGGVAATFALGSSSVMRDLAAQVELLAASDRTTVLLLGESGSGQGTRRRADSRAQPAAHECVRRGELRRADGGRARGRALRTGRAGGDNGREPHVGLFEVAAGGSLFLDEIGELSTHLQARLLRVFEGKGFRRVGGTREISADVRIIAATNRDLVNEVNEGRFREDLYYRLSVMPLYLPPLRARSREDLVELMGRIVDDLAPASAGGAARPSATMRSTGCCATRGRATSASCATCSSGR